MDHYLFAVRSATQAQRAARVLNSGGIHASVQRVPVEFARQGCTYAVRVDEADYDVAQQRLQQNTGQCAPLNQHEGTFILAAEHLEPIHHRAAFDFQQLIRAPPADCVPLFCVAH